MRRFLLAAFLTTLAGPLYALSCLAPDVATDYQRAAADEAVWIVVAGKLTFDESRLPRVNMQNQAATPPETDIPARLDGGSLGLDGFTRAFLDDITLRVLCLGPWCGGATSGEDYLAFLRREGDGYVAMAGPCSGLIYPNPTPEQLEIVTKCHRGGACVPTLRR